MDETNLVLGIDPGPEEHGVVLWDPAASRVRRAMNMRTIELQRYILDACEPGRDVIACEWIQSFGMKVGVSVFQTALSVGMIHAVAPGMRFVYRIQIKMHLCQSARAKDPNVRQALIDRFGECGTKKQPGPLYGISKHLWSALAVAVYAAEVCDPAKEFFPNPGLILTSAGV